MLPSPFCVLDVGSTVSVFRPTQQLFNCMCTMPALHSIQTVQVPVDRGLLDPRFDGYKLKIDGPFSAPRHIRLPTSINMGKVPSLAHDPFRKLEARSKFNHLFAFPGTDGAYYVDGNYTMVEVLYNEATADLHLRKVYQLPVPTGPTDTREYPSVRRAGSLFIVSDGGGTITILQHTSTDEFPVVGQFSGLRGTPILVDALLESDRRVLIMYYRMEEHEAEEPTGHTTTSFRDKQRSETHQRLSFFLSLLSVTLQDPPVGMMLEPRTVMTVEGFSAPFLASIEPDGNGFVVGAATPYENPALKQAVDAAAASSAPRGVGASAPTPNRDEKLDYKWMQTESDITITVRLPHVTLKSEVHCLFMKHCVKCKILPPKEETIFDAKIFDDIVPSDCLWTLEDNRMLTLYLQKANEGSRWTHLWDDENDDDVEETLDPNVIAEFASALEKYTSSAVDTDIPPYAAQDIMSERPEEVDFEGHAAVLMRYSLDANAGPTHMSLTGGREWLCTSFAWTPPVIPAVPRVLPITVALRSDIDALVYTIGTPNLSLTPAAAFNAFGFVQASKRDKRFMAFTHDARYMFIVESKRMYVYAQLPHAGATVADQYVVDLDEGGFEGQGDVLGVQQIAAGAVVVLREESLTLLTFT
ncbi:uncharacterized protein EV422DRAFT_83733 [Fimicolochytrium jonesii]|uniref:uncharacterized protein n=1 Tax=Fimicolochytrium jonesii TaxID=1396493 RepID=UPI0022FE268F|nr:uncharacterized protein EV422DRAFT_83733 [Fimicolochytrium jonesii]KAI8820225.1 hypothetical protein EV422DRAFT_83733 [Fimicolochytrium jonesii]